MTARGKIAIAVGGSALAHLLLVGVAVGWIAVCGVPENDHFSLRERLGDAKEVEAFGSNYAASREAGEPPHALVYPQSGSVWWSWRAPEGATDVLVEVKMFGGDPIVGIYQGFAVGKLDYIAHSDNGTVSFSPRPDEDYHIAVAGAGRDVEGSIKLSIRSYTAEDSEETPVEQEIALLPEIVIEENRDEPEHRAYVRTTQNERAADAPEDAAFESDRNTVAASELPPEVDGLENMPTQEGVELPTLEMADRELAEGEIADDATIPIAAVEIVEPQLAPEITPEMIELPPLEPVEQPVLHEAVVAELATPEPAALAERLLDAALVADAGDFAAEQLGERETENEGDKRVEEQPEEKVAEEEQPPERERAAVLEKPPPPTPTPGMEDAENEEVFQPQTRRNKVAGTISNRGKQAADAAETPLGHYTRKVTSAVEKRWHYERRRKADYVTFGSFRVSFAVDKDGKPGNLKIHDDEANPVMVDFTLGAILTAEIPPMPKEVREFLGSEPLEITYNVIIY